MLQKLTIENYAIIDRLETGFSGNMNILTGETGAGKSIIMGALGLILGDRADSSVLVNKDKKCIVEGVFLPGNKKSVQQFLGEHDFDAGEELVIRREISTSGKSRAFINDTPVNLSLLNELSCLLVDLHQQFDTLSLGNSDFQRDVLDALANNAELLEQYQQKYRQREELRKECDLLRQEKEQLEKESDYNQFQYNELEEAGFRPDELEQAEEALKMMSNAEGIKEALTRVLAALNESDEPLVQQLKVLTNHLNGVAAHHSGIPALVERIRSAQVELLDIADDLGRINDQVQHDPEKMEQLNDRLSLGYKLQKKHGVSSTRELLEIQQELEGKLQSVFEMGDVLQEKESAFKIVTEEAKAMAGKISKRRKEKINFLEAQVNRLLSQVGMPNARLKVEVISTELNEFGSDQVEFLFDGNRSGQFQPVKKVASGGELSRLMLCIKSLVAESLDMPTLIFDEIDTGISGEAARQVGLIMKALTQKRQVICITHQPQIAGKADAHFFVYKEIVNDQVKTNIRQLDRDERITAIARMLSGEKPTAAALENAREMVSN